MDAAFGGGAQGEAEEASAEAVEKDGEFAGTGDDDFGLTAVDAAHRLARGFFGGHDKELGNGVGLAGVLAEVVDAANLAFHETGIDTGDGHAEVGET